MAPVVGSHGLSGKLLLLVEFLKRSNSRRQPSLCVDALEVADVVSVTGGSFARGLGPP
jgi:hypothetical protein